MNATVKKSFMSVGLVLLVMAGVKLAKGNGTSTIGKNVSKVL
jgi:hypothetical protein